MDYRPDIHLFADTRAEKRLLLWLLQLKKAASSNPALQVTQPGRK